MTIFFNIGYPSFSISVSLSNVVQNSEIIFARNSPRNKRTLCYKINHQTANLNSSFQSTTILRKHCPLRALCNVPIENEKIRSAVTPKRQTPANHRGSSPFWPSRACNLINLIGWTCVRLKGKSTANAGWIARGLKCGRLSNYQTNLPRTTRWHRNSLSWPFHINNALPKSLRYPLSISTHMTVRSTLVHNLHPLSPDAFKTSISKLH